MPKYAVLYMRVSSKEQEEEGFSLEAQRALLERYARSNGLVIRKRFEESKTAKDKERRPEFARMVEFLRGRSTDTVILVEKVDRLYRNVPDWIALDELKVEIHFVRAGTVLSPTSHSSQKFQHGIQVLMAKNYVENLSEEIRKGMRTKAAQGAYPSHAPLGYRNTNDKTLGIEPDPVLGPLVSHIFDRAATGLYSIQELTRFARTMGLRTKRGLVLQKNTLATNVLRNPAYHGTFRWAGQLYEGKYQPLVTRATFDRVQEVLAARRGTKSRVHTFTYSGLLRCADCGTLLSGDLKKSRYVYYACNGAKCRKRFYPERAFEQQTVELLQSLRIDEAESAWLLEELRKRHEADGPDPVRIGRLRARRTELQRLRVKGHESRLLGEIDEELWKAESAAWHEELDLIDQQLRVMENAVSTATLVEEARKPLELLQAAADQFVRREPRERALLLKTMISNFTVSDGTLTPAMRSPYDVLAEGAKSKDWWS